MRLGRSPGVFVTVADWTLVVAGATLLATCVGIRITVVRGNRDRKTMDATRVAVEAISKSAEETKRLAEVEHSQAEALRRRQALRDFEAAIDTLEGALRHAPNVISVDLFESARARMLTSLEDVPDDLPNCQKLADEEQPWVNKAGMPGYIASARHELAQALARGR
jgi:hypothetical protein